MNVVCQWGSDGTNRIKLRYLDDWRVIILTHGSTKSQIPIEISQKIDQIPKTRTKRHTLSTSEQKKKQRLWTIIVYQIAKPGEKKKTQPGDGIKELNALFLCFRVWALAEAAEILLIPPPAILFSFLLAQLTDRDPFLRYSAATLFIFSDPTAARSSHGQKDCKLYILFLNNIVVLHP